MRRQLSIVIAVFALAAMTLGLLAAARFGLAERAPPARCPVGLVATAARCCAPGQVEEQGRCVGTPVSCPELLEQTPAGCVARSFRVRVPRGRVNVGPDHWESIDQPEQVLTVDAFELDAFEVTQARWTRCAAAGDCLPREGTEPGAPVASVSPKAAEAFCRFEGGRLPTSAEIWLASRGPEGRRFPWGPTGLVCRRAAYGLVAGPCANGARAPELAGARPDGATPDGIFDLAGNVAEWTRDGDRVAARGGSFRTRLATDLTSLTARSGEPADDIGFRCAYRPQR